jgi:hypothetical protein
MCSSVAGKESGTEVKRAAVPEETNGLVTTGPLAESPVFAYSLPV